MTQLSIIIPVYNMQATLERTLQSLQAISPARRGQVQVVAVNDGSTDQSPALLRQAAQRGGGFAWEIIDQTNAGLSRARNAAIERAAGRWLFFLDADDELLFDPTALLESPPEDVTAFGLSVESQSPGGGKRRVAPAQATPGNFFDLFSAQNPYQPSSLLFRHDRLDRPFDPGVNIVNDWLFWMENPRVFDRMERRADLVSARIHIHGSNMSSQYALAGRHRTAVARKMLLAHPDLSTRARNNFVIQERIGKLQETGALPGSALLTCRCDKVLYLKMWVYLGASLLGMRATRFAAACEDTPGPPRA